MESTKVMEINGNVGNVMTMIKTKNRMDTDETDETPFFFYVFLSLVISVVLPFFLAVFLFCMLALSSFHSVFQHIQKHRLNSRIPTSEPELAKNSKLKPLILFKALAALLAGCWAARATGGCRAHSH